MLGSMVYVASLKYQKGKHSCKNGALKINLPHAIFNDAHIVKTIPSGVRVFSFIDCHEKHMYFWPPGIGSSEVAFVLMRVDTCALRPESDKQGNL